MQFERKKAQLSYTKLMEKWSYESTRFQLHSAKLDMEPYNSLINKPARLIFELYNHPRISSPKKDHQIKIPGNLKPFSQ